jgi:uncharacterized protein (DUF2336 family)
LATAPTRQLPDDLNVDDLLRIAHDRSAIGRSSLVDAVGNMLFDGSRSLTARETELMTDILRRLIHEVEISVRKGLAERLAVRSDAPRELVVELANDDIEVAHDILSKSPVLLDTELVSVVRNRTREHQLAVACRNSVSEAVADALVETGDSGVIKTLLENDSAAISKATLEYLVEQSHRVDELQNPLLHRNDLTPDLARRMYWWVSAALRQHILSSFDVSERELDEAIETTVKDVIADARAREQSRRDKVGELVDHLWRTNALTPKFLIQVLREGEIPLFEAMFARLTGLDIKIVRNLLYEVGGTGITVACKASRIEKPDFASIFLLSRQARPGDKQVDPTELSKVLSLFDRLSYKLATDVVRRWRMDEDYAAAIYEVQQRLETNQPN